MEIRLILIWMVAMSMGNLYAQQAPEEEMSTRFYLYEQDGETFMNGSIEGIDIEAPRPNKRTLRKGKRRLAKFTKLLWNVHKTYPYAIKVAEVVKGVESELDGITDAKERKAFLKTQERSLFGEYEDDLRKMSRSQGKVLVKLIHRETGSATYFLIKEMKSGASAVLWQSIGIFFGINLKSEYDPEEEEMIEEIIFDLQRGGYNICYKQYNYYLR